MLIVLRDSAVTEKWWGGSNSGVEEFVPVDSSGDAAGFVVQLHPQHLTVTPDIHIRGRGNFLREHKNEFDLGTGFVLPIGGKKEAAETHVSCLALLLRDTGRAIRPYCKRKCHRKTPRGAAFCIVCHRFPPEGAPDFLRKPSIEAAKPQSQRECNWV